MSEISTLMSSNSPMASPIGGGTEYGPPQPQLSTVNAYGGPQVVQNAMAQQYAQPQYVPDDDDMPVARKRVPTNTTNNLMGSLLDDPDKKVTLVVMALLILAQHQQTKDMFRNAAKSAGMQLAGSPYENVVISGALAAGFYYFLINYM